MVNVCDLPLSELTIGQVVKFPNHYAVIIQISMRVGGHWLDWESIRKGVSSYHNDMRYSEVTYLMENGRVVTPMFHINNDYLLVDRVISESEINDFNNIVENEKDKWILK